MSGLLGGILRLVHLLGGSVLFVLVGKKAWIETDDGSFYRSAAGTISIGLVVALFLYFFILPDSRDPSVKPGLAFCAAPILIGVFIFVLEYVNEKLEG